MVHSIGRRGTAQARESESLHGVRIGELSRRFRRVGSVGIACSECAGSGEHRNRSCAVTCCGIHHFSSNDLDCAAQPAHAPLPGRSHDPRAAAPVKSTTRRRRPDDPFHSRPFPSRRSHMARLSLAIAVVLLMPALALADAKKKDRDSQKSAPQIITGLMIGEAKPSQCSNCSNGSDWDVPASGRDRTLFLRTGHIRCSAPCRAVGGQPRVCPGRLPEADRMWKPLDRAKVHLRELPAVLRHRRISGRAGPSHDRAVFRPLRPVMSQIVAFRSAKGRPFAERKATMRQTETLPSGSQVRSTVWRPENGRQERSAPLHLFVRRLGEHVLGHPDRHLGRDGHRDRVARPAVHLDQLARPCGPAAWRSRCGPAGR